MYHSQIYSCLDVHLHCQNYVHVSVGPYMQGLSLRKPLECEAHAIVKFWLRVDSVSTFTYMFVPVTYLPSGCSVSKEPPIVASKIHIKSALGSNS